MQSVAVTDLLIITKKNEKNENSEKLKWLFFYYRNVKFYQEEAVQQSYMEKGIYVSKVAARHFTQLTETPTQERPDSPLASDWQIPNSYKL